METFLAKSISLSGNRTAQQQWENGNSSVAFPFADDSLPEGFPTEAVVDACIVVPAHEDLFSASVTLECLHVSRHMVSAVFAVDGVAALACKALATDYEPYLPRKMEALDPMYSGMVTFGGIDFGAYSNPLTLRKSIRVSDAAVIRPVVGRLRRFVKTDTGQVATGDVGIILPEELQMEISERGDTSTVAFSAKDGKDIVERPCDGAESSLVPIKSINGVFPDAGGTLAIVFGGNQ